MADKDNNELSADEFDDNVDSDVENEIIDEGDDNDELPEDHTKMVAFHTAIKAVLERQLEKMQGEVRETGRLVTIGVEVKHFSLFFTFTDTFCVGNRRSSKKTS